MNPPSALHSAMSRDRKPFTYTPGGLDLSEIKSSRMAARLMRNAMNEGVPELPKQHIQSPPTSSTPIAVPNFNCLPVQVFPAFNLPANPKSLLRTRSNPGQPRVLPVQKVPPPQTSQFVNNSRTAGVTQYDTFKINSPHSQTNNNRPMSMYEYGSPANTYKPTNHGNGGYTPEFPAISYDAEYFQTATHSNNPNKGNVTPSIKTNVEISGSNGEDNFNSNFTNPKPFNEEYKKYAENCEVTNRDTTLPFYDTSQYQENSEKIFKPDIGNKEISLSLIDTNKHQDNFDDIQKFVENKYINTPFSETNTCDIKLEDENKLVTESIDQSTKSAKMHNDNECSFNPEVDNKETAIDIFVKPTGDYSTFVPETVVEKKPIEDLTSSYNEKKEVKVVKKQTITKKENKVAEQNGSTNGESEVPEIIKAPSEESAAITTKVEVSKKTLPDGSIEEVKKTITKTTIGGKTEIRTKTETKIIPKEDDEEEVEEEEEEEEEEDINEVTAQQVEKEEIEKKPKIAVVKKTTEEIAKPEENGQKNIIKTEERSETTTTTSKKVVVVQDEQDEEKEDDEVAEGDDDVEQVEPVTFVIKQPAAKPNQQEEIVEDTQDDEEVEEEEEAEETEDETNDQKVILETKEDIPNSETESFQPSVKKQREEEVEEEEYEEAEEKAIVENDTSSEPETKLKEKKKDENLENTEKEAQAEEKIIENKPAEPNASEETTTPEVYNDKQEKSQELTDMKQEVIVEKSELKNEKQETQEETLKSKVENEKAEQKVPLREPSVPLEKVEDVEIKPIGLGDFLTKTRTENTEIITNVTEKPTGLLTEINRIENIVTVNRTTKTLDRSYEDILQQGIPTVKTYFTPHIDKVSTSPLPARPYQPVYPPEPTTERRHSLLLERLSVERQMPSDIYQNNNQYSNQTEQQRQWSQEPQAEVLTVSNVKPSQITNQQWYQQKENAIYNNVTPSPQPAQATAPSWTQPKPQTQPSYQPQPQFQHSPQPQYQAPPQPQYQAPPQPQYQASSQPQYQAPPQPQYQSQPQYQTTYTENVQENTSNTYQNTYSTYTPKPTNWASSTKPLSPIPTIITPSQPSQYNYINKDSSESYLKTTQNYSPSSYVPPPWEQDATYVAPEAPQNYYQPAPPTSSFSPVPNKGWKPNIQSSKFNKTPPTAYIPPKPNQSFVVPVSTVEPPKQPGRKTYYSEYERRYISVPESTYIPGESKFQHQPDPSPAYYYDNNEPAESVEPQWRRELREFTEKSQTQTTTETNVKPPWEAETKYSKAPEQPYTPTPTWSQTVRPQSWRERSFESEFVSQEWPKTNTLGRGRPLSSYGKETIPERTRGVSVDRYNPNNYQSPVVAEHPPVQTHTHVPPAPHATGYHNPNVPAYHARVSAEPREQVSYQQPRNLREARASPIQSRSFKYLQWITGTED